MNDDAYHLFEPQSASDLSAARALFQAYADELPIDLGFQGFEAELLNLPGPYTAPRGALRLLRSGSDWTGCCALRPLDAVDYPNAGEMKRLYVAPAFRGMGYGRTLTEDILDVARRIGYSCVLLDTLSEMETARALYEDLGFVEIPPYYHNPVAGAHYLKVDL
jgi:putative acetyltransferase